MDSSSEGDDNHSGRHEDNNDVAENQIKPKRKMKTPFQLEILEKAYAADNYPTETARVELSEKLGLTDRQLQMWFCHRRLKDKKGIVSKKSTPLMNVEKTVMVKEKLEVGTEPGSGSRSGSSRSDYKEPEKMGSWYAQNGDAAVMQRRNMAVAGDDVAVMQRRNVDDMAVMQRRNVGMFGDDVAMQRRYKSLESITEMRAIAAVEKQLGEPIREDGPILGMEFDPLPPDAFGAPIETMAHVKGHGSYDNKLYEQIGARSNKASMRDLEERQYFHDQSSNRFDQYERKAVNQLHASPSDGLSAKTSPYTHSDQLSLGYGHKSHLTDTRPSSQHHKGHALSFPLKDEAHTLPRDSKTNIKMEGLFSGHAILDVEPFHVSRSPHMEDAIVRVDKKRKIDEEKISKEIEAHEKRIRRELDKQDILRRKMEEQMRKEMEKQDRERRKEEERLIREKMREEERLLREQKKENERREKFLYRESLKAEKRRQKEEIRKEKEAVRQKAAIERASARKIARESMELIEDERLELMELAASSNGLSLITSLNHDTLNNLDSFRDLLTTFPPMSVQLKRPFSLQPWNNSDENMGNLFMVWKFLINFADVLELWPFTLDEFVQAFHDYDSRLMGEIHVALLKLIIKDIEDVARTPSTGQGTNPGGSVNPEGGHPHIVQGAYAWGFSICSWQKHLNPLTWPEILRQMAISAGFGPRLKKKAFKLAYLDENIEGKAMEGVEDVISTLRNGSAAENAVARMHERGFSLPRKSRHRLTPGTVKFAAFHVLSLEGSKGLMISELADKIQKSGLRDLRTSKTPEASIGVALSRDTKLFERIAPSTYRVRTAFRKDPAEAEALLSAAREKLSVFENGFLVREDPDGVEKDEDSDCDVAEGPEIDLLLSTPLSNKNPDIDLLNTPLDKNKDIIYFDEEIPLLGDEKGQLCNDIGVNLQNNEPEIRARVSEQQETEIDESKLGEIWVQGLAESEYYNLSVEERLNALVALIGVANEGNAVRAVLEDRLEAANALRKQMWAEAQLDKRRLKEEYITKYIKDNETHFNITIDQKQFNDPQTDQNHHNALVPNSEALAVQDSEQNKYAAERSRAQLKSFIGHKAEEMYVYRSLPLGQDRRRNRYWLFVASASKNDPGSGRIFVQLHDGHWRLIDTEEAFDALLSSLETRGIRESHLNLMLRNIESTFKENVRRKLKNSEVIENDSMASPSSIVCGTNSDKSDFSSSSFKVELGRNGIEKNSIFKRYKSFEEWIWKECFNAITLCAIKHGKERCDPILGKCDSCLDSYILEVGCFCSCIPRFATSEERKKIHESYSIPLGLRMLKALLSSIEVCVPPEALHSYWTEEQRKIWSTKLHASSSLQDILKILTQLELTIKREFLSSNFETTRDLLGPTTLNNVYDSLESVPELPWIPQTSAAVTLRLLELDGSILYVPRQQPEPREDNQGSEFANLPSTSGYVCNKEDTGLTEMDLYNQMMENPTATDLVINRSKFGRGRGGRGHGRGAPGEKIRKRVSGSKSKFGRPNSRNGQNCNSKFRRDNEQVSGWGRRIVRGRRPEKHISHEVSPVNEVELPIYPQEEDEDESDSDDEVARATGLEHGGGGGWDVSFHGGPGEETEFRQEFSDEEMEGFEDESDSEAEEHKIRNFDAIEEEINEVSDEMVNRAANEDEGYESAYSDDDDDSE